MNDLTEHLPVLRPVRDDKDLERLVTAAAEDNHLVLAPTFVIEKGGELAGYIGLNSTPTFQGWFHSERIGPRDSALIFNQIENMCRMKMNTPGWDQLLLLLPTTSPFREVMERFGYRRLAEVGMWLKGLR